MDPLRKNIEPFKIGLGESEILTSSSILAEYPEADLLYFED